MRLPALTNAPEVGGPIAAMPRRIAKLASCLSLRAKNILGQMTSPPDRDWQRRLLSPCAHRPRRLTTKARREFAPPHPSSLLPLIGTLSRSGTHGNGLHLAGGQPPATFFAAREAALGLGRKPPWPPAGVRCLGSTCRGSVGPNPALVTHSGGRTTYRWRLVATAAVAQ
jgi:hypothetical protein